MRISDWSSDVCSSDLTDNAPRLREILLPEHAALVEQRDGDAAVARIGGVVGDHRFALGVSFDPLEALLGDPARRQPAAHRLRAARRPHPVVHFGRVRSAEHTSELQSLMRNSYAVFCLT